MCTHNLCFEQNEKNIKIFQLKIAIFTAVSNCPMLHGRVCVMFNILLLQNQKLYDLETEHGAFGTQCLQNLYK